MTTCDVHPPVSLSHRSAHRLVSRREALHEAGAVLAAGIGFLSQGHVAAAPAPLPAVGEAAPFVDSVGPVDGELRFDPLMASFRSRRFFLDVADCTISGTFYNPHAVGQHTFTYGFRFRMTGDRGMLVYVSSTGYWVRVSYDDEGRSLSDRRQFGSLVNLRGDAGEANDLQLLLTGDVGELRVNGENAAAFRLDELASGNVEVVGSHTPAMGMMLPEVVTRYEGFVVGPPSPPSPFAQAARGYLYGPASGGITHLPDNGFVEYRGTNLRTRDGVVSARFFVPYDDPMVGWDCGFVLRETETQELRVIIQATRQYAIVVGSRPNKDAQWTRRQTMGGVLRDVRVAEGAFNDMEMVLNGDASKLTVNGTPLQASFDLSSVPEPGLVYVATGLRGSERRGAVTRYENFTVAPLP